MGTPAASARRTATGSDSGPYTPSVSVSNSNVTYNKAVTLTGTGSVGGVCVDLFNFNIEKEIYECWNYKNLQPLTINENKIKSNKYESN
jgi:hypothetical protein